jgi:hypothetical protein
MNQQSLFRGVMAGLVGVALLGWDSTVQADVERDTTATFSFAVDNPCTVEFEQLNVTGVVVVTTKTTTNPNGSTHFSVYSRGSGTVTDPTTGVVYNIKSQDRFSFFDSNGAPVLTTFTLDYSAITPGPDPNFIVHNRVEAILSASGEAALSSNFFSECKGNQN